MSLHQPLLRTGGDEDTMEISSDAGRPDNNDIEIDGIGIPSTPHDDPMGDFDNNRADQDDYMHDEIQEEEMIDMIDDGDEELQDFEYDITAFEDDTIVQDLENNQHDLDYDLIDEPADEPATIAPTQEPDEDFDEPDNYQEEVAIEEQPTQESTLKDITQALQSEPVGEEEHSEGVAVETSLPTRAPVPDLHPCVVEWDGSEMSLFSVAGYDHYLIQDAACAHTSLSHLFRECRNVLGDSVDDNLELVFDISELELRIREDVVNESTCSLADIVDIYVNLHLNDGVETPEPLRLILSSRTKFEKRIDELREAATSGYGFSYIVENYSEGSEGHGEYVDESGPNAEDDAKADTTHKSKATETEQHEDVENNKKDSKQPEEQVYAVDQPQEVEQPQIIQAKEKDDAEDGTGTQTTARDHVLEPAAGEGEDEDEINPEVDANGSVSSPVSSEHEESAYVATGEIEEPKHETAGENDGPSDDPAGYEGTGAYDEEYAAEIDYSEDLIQPGEDAVANAQEIQTTGAASNEQHQEGEGTHQADPEWNAEADETYEIDYSDDEGGIIESNGVGQSVAEGDGESQYVDAAEVPDEHTGDGSEIVYDEEDEIEVPADALSEQAIPAPVLAPTLSKKRSFFEHEGGNETSDEVETKKLRPT